MHLNLQISVRRGTKKTYPKFKKLNMYLSIFKIILLDRSCLWRRSEFAIVMKIRLFLKLIIYNQLLSEITFLLHKKFDELGPDNL